MLARMGEMADESAAELVDRAIENVMAFKRVALLLDDLSPDREAADRLVRAFEEERAAPWLTAHLLGCIGHEAGYATVRQILVSAPGMSAEGYAGVALAKIRGDDAFDELVALMGGAVDRRSREGAAYGLGQLAATPDLALPIVIDALSSAGQLLEVLPLPEFLDATKALGHVHTELDDDGISRGVHLFQGIGEPHWPHLALALDTQQRALDQVPVASCETPSFSIQNIRCDYRRVPFVGEPGSFATLSAADILSGNHAAEVRAALVGKTVLVGLTATGVSDWVTTPVSGRSRPMAGVEFNANVLAAVRQGTLIEDAPRYVGLILVLILALVPPLVLPRLPPGSMLLATIAFVAVPVLVFYLLLYFVRLYVPLSSAAVAAALTYPLWSWRRLEVAWRFVTQEIQRFSAERLQLGFTALDNNRLATVVSHVGTLLNAQSDQQIFNADGEQQVVCREEHDKREGEAVHRLVARVSHGRRRFQLSLARPDAFSDAEKSLCGQRFERYGTPPRPFRRPRRAPECPDPSAQSACR